MSRPDRLPDGPSANSHNRLISQDFVEMSRYLLGMSRITDQVLLVGVCGVAAALRLWDLDLMEFKGDEAGVIDLALPLAQGRALPLKGLVSSVGIHNPPLFIYLVALPTAIHVDARFVTGALVGLSHVAAVGMIFTWIRNRRGTATALMAALMFASAPWVVLYGRKLWAQDVLPPFVVAGMWLCERFWRKPGTRTVAGLPIVLCALFQLHLSAIAVFVLVGAMLLAGYRRIHVGALAAGSLVAVLMLTPYLVHQGNSDFHDLRGFQNMALGKRANGKPRRHEKVWSTKPFSLTTRVATDHGLAYATGRSNGAFVASRTAAGRWLSRASELASIALWLVGLAMLAATLARKGTRTPARIALAFWVFGYPGAMFVLRLEEQYPHYFIMLYPAIFIVMALPFGVLKGLRSPLARRGFSVLATGLATVVLVGNLATLGAFHAFIRDRGGTAGDYGVAFIHKYELVQWLVAQRLPLDSRRYELHHLWRMTDGYGNNDALARILAARGSAPEGSERARVFSTLLRPEVAGRRCRGRQDFGPLVVCPHVPKR